MIGKHKGYIGKVLDLGRKQRNTQANLLHTNTESKESKETQEKQEKEKQEKEILEIYFSYGDDTTRLQGDSRHTQDVNLHIITQGYEEGEKIHIALEIQGKSHSIIGRINDNQAIIMNIFKA